MEEHLSLLPYPTWIEDWWLSWACREMKLSEPADCLEQLAPQVQALSDRFITEEGRRALGLYGDEDALLLAYGLFFFPQTFSRVQFPLLEALFRGWAPPEGRPLRILDLGAGLGSASLGAAMLLGHHHPSLDVHVDIVEHAAKSIRWGQSLVAARPASFSSWVWETQRHDMRRWEEPFATTQTWDLIIASFSLNEAYEGRPLEEAYEWLTRTAARLAPGGLLLVLEPASQVSCERLEGLRDQVAAAGERAIWGPCLHEQACPLLATGESYCHEVRSWKVPDSLRWLNRKMYRNIESLRYGFLMLGQEAPRLLQRQSFCMRMIAPMIKKKGRWIGAGCGGDGRHWSLELQTRHIDAELKRALKFIERGDLIRLSVAGMDEEEQGTQESFPSHPSTGWVRTPAGTRVEQLFGVSSR